MPCVPGSWAAYAIRNADGSEARQCGNGVRCLVAWLRREGVASGAIQLEGPAGLVACRIDDGGMVEVDMGVPLFEPAAVPFDADADAPTHPLDVDGHRSRSGSPRWAIRTPSCASTTWPPRRSPRSARASSGIRVSPTAANVGFAEPRGRAAIGLRVWERGVGETLACGTGACAAVAVLRRQGLRRRARGGDTARRDAYDRVAGRRPCAAHERTRGIRLRRGMDRMNDLPAKRELGDLDVAAYLRRHAEFLSEFPDLALVLKLPRQLGSTTSLASYQLEVLRDKNRALTRRLQELVAIASENEQLVVRVHALTLSLMRADLAG